MKSPLALLSASTVVALLIGSSFQAYGTSIIFPAFSSPIIDQDRAYFSHTYGKRVICFDLKRRTPVWRRDFDFSVEQILLIPGGDILVCGGNQDIILSKSTGEITSKRASLGRSLVFDSQGRLFGLAGGTVRCQDFKNSRVLWEYPTKYSESYMDMRVAGGLAFIQLRPMGMESEYRKPPRITEGESSLLVLDTKEGSLLWRESLPLNHSEFDADLCVKAGKRFVACSTSIALRLIDAKTGKIVREYKSPIDICDFDWWGDSRLVLCTGNIDWRSDQKTIQVLNVDDLKSEFNFRIKALEAADACVVGDVLIVGSLYRNYGIDLTQRREVWQDFQIHSTVHAGLLYYGTSERGEKQQDVRVFGVRDPRTGKTTVLYREPVNTQSRPALNE